MEKNHVKKEVIEAERRKEGDSRVSKTRCQEPRYTKPGWSTDKQKGNIGDGQSRYLLAIGL